MFVPLAAFGLVFGSFSTALSYRLPRGESIAHGRSRCPSCGHTLTAPDLVPVLSWVAHRGACRHCAAGISWRYPAIELVTMLLFVAAGVVTRDLTHLLLLLAMTPVMVTLAVIDLENQRLPDVLVLPLAGLAFAWRWAGDGDFLGGLTTAVVVVVLGVMLNAAYKARTGKTGLGMGDTKLFALAGVALPVGPFLVFGALAAFFGVVFGLVWLWRRGSSQFPFAPVILGAYWACLAAGEIILQRLVILRTG